MGEVWKARDSRLNRDVAIKTSHIGFNGRFQVEARAVAALNHPNICTLHDAGPDYLVMEYIEGLTLADRINQGPVPVGEALAIAKQIADALEAAHDKGIVHRDLKPANIKIRPDGSVKVLDFGLAKAGEAQEVTPDSPTMLSTLGMILGTAGYMSPEQARGQAVDKRADIWAFGVVLYEMLTAKRLFDGTTASDSLAAVLTREPDLTPAPEKTRRLLASCLEKDPKKRLRDIGDWARLLEDGPPRVELRESAKLPWIVATAAMGLVAIAVTVFHLATARPPATETRVDIVTAPTIDPFSFALSPDGRQIAYVASGVALGDGPSRLWVRPLDSTTGQSLPGTEGARNPFWSPDNRSLGFFADFKLKRIDIGGGQPQTLTDGRGGGVGAAAATWSSQGVILFTPDSSSALFRIPASGGTAMAVTKLARQYSHRAPRFLPDGRQFLFAATGVESGIWLGSLDGGVTRRLAPIAPGNDSAAEYLAPGWLVRVQQNNLVAQHFDAVSGRLSGDSVTLAQGVRFDPATFAGAFSVSSGGMIAYRAGGGGRQQLVWFNRAGQNTGVFGPPVESLFHPELSPDGKRAGITRGPFGASDIWIEEGTRSTRFTFDAADDRYAIWSPDGERVVFASDRKGTLDLYQKPANASGTEEVLLQSADLKRPNSWSPDGRFILYASSQNNTDLMVLPMTGERKPFPFLSTPFSEQQGTFSPDGRWVAYQSNESGRLEIYVRSFPGPGGQWQVSSSGGISPRWRADGKELYYVAADNQLMASSVVVQGGTLTPGTPMPLFQTHIVDGPFRPQYDVARDGRFLINTELSDRSTEPIHLIQNWKPATK